MIESIVSQLQTELRRFGRSFGDARLADAVRSLKDASHPSSLEYPWPDLEVRLIDGRLPLLAYGSLMDRESASRTLSNYASLNPTPVVAFGGRRIYHYRMPEESIARYPDAAPLESAALNVIGTRTPSDYFNAVLLQIPVADLPQLREREKQYDLIALPFLNWDGSGAKVGLGYALSSPRGSAGKTDDSILPLPGYHRLCLRGASGFGPDFAGCFLETSLLNDGRTAKEAFPDDTPEG